MGFILETNDMGLILCFVKFIEGMLKYLMTWRKILKVMEDHLIAL